MSAAELDPEEASALAARVPRFAHGSRVPGWDQAVDLWKDPAEIPDPARVDVPAALRAQIERHMANYPDRRSAVLPAMAAAQRVHGWCSPEAIRQVACVMRVTPAYLESVASFYDMLELRPVGRHSVFVCTNISCSLRGADALHEAFVEATGDDDDFNVRAFECLGACDIAPMASVDGVYVGPLETDDVQRLLDDVRAGRPVLPDKQLATRAVADPHANSRQWPAHDHLAHPPGESDEAASPETAATATAGAAQPDIDPDAARFGAPMGAGEPGGDAHEGRGATAAPIEHAPPVEHAPHTDEADEADAEQGGDEDVRQAESTEDRAARRDPERDDPATTGSSAAAEPGGSDSDEHGAGSETQESREGHHDPEGGDAPSTGHGDHE